MKARTQRQTILAHCPLFYGRTLPTGGVWMLCELWQHFSSEFCRNRDLGTNNWDNCTKGATLPNVTTWTSAAVSSQTHFLSVAIEEFPLFYQSSTAPRILDIATILPKDLTLAVTSSPLPSFNMPHSLWRSSYLSPVSTHFSAPSPSPRQQPSWKHHSTVSLPTSELTLFHHLKQNRPSPKSPFCPHFTRILNLHSRSQNRTKVKKHRGKKNVWLAAAETLKILIPGSSEWVWSFRRLSDSIISQIVLGISVLRMMMPVC